MTRNQIDQTINSVSSKDFIKQFIEPEPTHFNWQNAPVQIYPLHEVSKYLITPTSLFRPTYNFLVFLQSGHFTQQVGTQTVNVESPAILWILNGGITSIREISEQIDGYFLLIKEQTVNTIYDKKDSLNLFTIDPVLNLSDADKNWFNALLKLMEKELKKNQPTKRVTHGLLQALLFKVLDCSDSSKSLTHTDQVAIEFKQLVQRHFKEEQGVSFYANKLAVSENYLNRCVNSVFNKSTKQVITEIRILQSQLLLWDVSKDVSEIGYELNFNDPSYFSRVFKKVTGQTPSEYRASVYA